jgi:hypothetical protein
MWHFASPVHPHGMIYLYIGNFMYIFTFVSGETDILKKQYYILECKDVLSGTNSPRFWRNCNHHLFKWRQWFPVKKHQQISATAHNLRTSGMLQQQLLSEFMFGGICSYISFIHVLRVSYNFGSCV